MNYTIEKAASGWNIFKSVRSHGKYLMLHVEGPYEKAHALMLEFLNNERLIRKGIASLKQRRIRLKAIRKAIYIDVDNPWTSLLHPPTHEGDQTETEELMMQMHYTIDQTNYTIKQATSGWNIFQEVPVNPQPYRIKGTKCRNCFVMHVKGSYKDAHNRLLEYVNNKRKLLADIFGETPELLAIDDSDPKD